MTKLKNYIAIVLDRSGSMSAVRREAVAVFNNLVQTIQQKSQDQETMVSFFTFANRAETMFFNADVLTLKPLQEHHYVPDGLTALFDGVGLAIDMFKGVRDAHEEHVSFLVIVITDGEENNSQRHTSDSINKLLKDTQSTDRWSFAFQVPPGSGKKFADYFGIPSDNIREWENTREGTIESGVATQAGLGNYFTARRAGKKAVRSFFVQTDMADVSADDIKGSLVDQSDRFKLYDVPREASVKEFVEQKTRKPYVIGSAYYLLMKTEKIQPRKQVLIMEKGKKAVWGGAKARKLIGLPDGAEAKVVPGNHANYDIYVQSTSVNRKLPRGTKLLFDTQQTTDLPPTWDHMTLTTSK